MQCAFSNPSFLHTYIYRYIKDLDFSELTGHEFLKKKTLVVEV